MRKGKSINVENIVTIELIDRRTGKVIERKVSKNATGPAGAFALIYLINGQPADMNVMKNWKYFYLFTSGKALIKFLEGSWSVAEDVGGAVRAVFTANDSSTDAYDSAYQGLYWRNDANSPSQMGLFQTQTISKTADKILGVTWEVRVSYSTP
jgi:hypothetical protein